MERDNWNSNCVLQLLLDLTFLQTAVLNPASFSSKDGI